MVQKKDDNPEPKAKRRRKKSSEVQPVRDFDPLRNVEELIDSALRSVLEQEQP
jgi:hypothetical protein